MKKKSQVTNLFIHICFIIACVMCLIPFILLVSVSLSSETDLINRGYLLIPKSIDLSAYKYIFKNPSEVLNAYRVTIFTTVLGTFISVIIMSMTAYSLSRSNFSFKKSVSFFLFFSMLFSGGLVPLYILISHYLKLTDSVWVYIFPSLVVPYHIFMCRAFFKNLPAALFESAKIDGASEWRILFQIVMPLSKPVIATVALFGILTRWNDWFTALLYIQKQDLISLQYLLQRIMKNIELIRNNSEILALVGDGMEIPNNNLRMAMAVVCAGPILFVFPFFQKYFVRGLMVGSVKG